MPSLFEIVRMDLRVPSVHMITDTVKLKHES